MSDDVIVIREEDRPVVDFVGGATYRTVIGDDTGAGLPIRTGIQTSPPGYQTRVHSHPYVETLTVVSGRGEAWLDGEAGIIAMEPGVTIVLPENRNHAFRVVGDEPLITFGIHTFGKRIVNYKDTKPPNSPIAHKNYPRSNPVISAAVLRVIGEQGSST